MKKLLILLLAALVLALAACDNDISNTYDQVMKEGRTAIHQGNYAKAAVFFEQAQKIKKGDSTAHALYIQTRYLVLGKKEMKRDRFANAIRDLNHVLMQKGGSGMLIKEARKIKQQAEAEQTGQAAGFSEEGSQQSVASSSGTAASSAVSQTTSVTTIQAGASTQSGSSERASDSSTQTASSQVSSIQEKAEIAVAQVAGYTPNKVYFLTKDNGTYYSIELRENNSGNSAADPETAPSIGFFRYYKATGKIMQLDLISNKYQEVK